MKKHHKYDYDKQFDSYKKIQDVASELIIGNKEVIKEPMITYVIPVYRRADLLEKTLHSILNQKDIIQAWNIVIVDNEAGGENDTERLVRKINSHRILYYRNKRNLGVVGNYNRCIELANGKWIAMLHGDDLITNDHLKINIENIDYCQKQKLPLAYIFQRYIDFSDEREVIVDRFSDQNNSNSIFLEQIFSDGKPKLLPQKAGCFSGNYGSLPSFGTIMNREIMLKEGGFAEEYGICSDIITPYKLAKKYGVYISPVYTGYHRFDRNESSKKEVILEVYDAMTDFIEYMYYSMFCGCLWKAISKDVFCTSLRNYCIGQSRFSDKKLNEEDFNSIYKIKRVSKIKRYIYRIVNRYFSKIYDLDDNYHMICNMIEKKHDLLKAAILDNKHVVLFGTGMVSEYLVDILRDKYPKIIIEGFAVSATNQQKKKLGYPIKLIDDYSNKKDSIMIITATIVEKYQEEMIYVLQEKGFNLVVSLLD